MAAPGYKIQCVYSASVTRVIDCPLFRSFEERTTVQFADNSTRKLQAYVDSGEGVDRAGGFAIQVGDISLLDYLIHSSISGAWRATDK
jgi:predicted house-cleaning NTP pyrophosphatase (Maf/HAM1 superfamily)